MFLVYRISINTRKGASDVGMDTDSNIDSNTDTPTDDTLRMEPSSDTQVRMGDPTLEIPFGRNVPISMS